MSTALSNHLVSNRSRLEAALPSSIDVGDFVRLTLTEVQKNPQLAECDPQSVFLAVMEAARLGVVPGALGHGWLIPRRVKGRMQCSFQPGYRLFVELARRSGEVKRVDAHVVYENDEFELSFGTDPKLIHKPALTSDEGDPIGAYAVAHLKDGGIQVEYMKRKEIEKARAEGASNSPAWTKWWDQMAKKVVLKRASKLWPMAIEDRRAFESLVNLDHTAEGFNDLPVAEATPIAQRVKTFTDDLVLEAPATEGGE